MFRNEKNILNKIGSIIPLNWYLNIRYNLLTNI
jgi:hypothetical protein